MCTRQYIYESYTANRVIHLLYELYESYTFQGVIHLLYELYESYSPGSDTPIICLKSYHRNDLYFS